MSSPSFLSLSAARSFLASYGWLATCAPDFVTALLAAGQLRHLRQGASTHHAGDAEGGIWGLVSGHVLSATGLAGPETSLTILWEPGEWGGTGPVSGFRRQQNLYARVPTTLLAVPQLALHRLLDERPAWWAEVNRLNFHIMLKIGLLAADLQTVDSRRRVAGALLNAAGLRLEGDELKTLPLSQEDVGHMANLSRYPTGQILRGFASDGLIASGYGQIRIERPAELRAIAEGTGQAFG